MTRLKKVIVISATLILFIIIGSLPLGIRFGTNCLEKKLLSAINARILENLSGQVKWEKVRLDLLRNMLVFEGVSFFPNKQAQPVSLSVKKIQARYSFKNIFNTGRLLFSRVKIEGLQGSWIAPDAFDKKYPYDKIPLEGELVLGTLMKANAYVRKVRIVDSHFQMDFPKAGREVIFRQIELSAEFPPKGPIALQVHVPGIRITGQKRDECFTLPRASVHLGKDALSLDSFTLAAEKGEENISLEGELSYSGGQTPGLAVFYQGQINGKRIQSLWPSLPFSSSPLIVKGKIEGPLESPLLKGTLHVARLTPEIRGKSSGRTAGQAFPAIDNLESRYLIEKGKITLSRVSFSTLSGTVSGQAEFFLPKRTFSLAASLDDLKLDRLVPTSRGRTFPLDIIRRKFPDVKGKVSFQGALLQSCRLSGSGEFDLRFSDRRAQGSPLFWQTKFSLAGEKSLHFTSSSLKLAGNALDFHGDFNLSARENLKNLRFDLHLNNVAYLSTLWPLMENTGGELSFSGDMAGAFSDPRICGSLVWKDAVFKRYSAQTVEGMITYDKKSVILSHLNLLQNQTRVSIDGKISTRNGQGTLHAEADPIYYDDLEKILSLHAPVLIKGRMACTSDFQILPHTPRLFFGQGEVTTGEWSIADKRHPFLKQQFDTVTSRFDVDAHTFHLDQTVGWKGRQKVMAELIIPVHHNVPASFFRFTSQDWNLSCLTPIREHKIPLEGRSSFQVQGSGAIGSGDWNWELTVRQPQYEGFSLDQMMAAIHMQGNEYQGEVRAGENTFSVRGNLNQGISYQLDGRIPQLKVEQDLANLYGMIQRKALYQDPKNNHLLAGGGKIFVGLSGKVRASGCLRDFEQSEGEFLATQAAIQTPLHNFTASQPFTIAYRQGRIFISDSSFVGEGVEARIRGEADQHKQLNISFSGAVPMTYLEQKCKLLSGSTGNLQFDFSLKGRMDAPRLSGRLKAVDCSFDLPLLNRRIEDIQGDLLIGEQTITIPGLTGTCHEGRVSLDGKLDWQGLAITSVDLNLRGEDILLASPSRYKFLLKGDLHWQGGKEYSDLSGVVEVQEGRYHRDVGFLQALLTKRRRIDIDEKSLSSFQTSGLEWLNNMSYDIRVSIPQNVWVKSSFFTAEIARSDFAVKGNNPNPYPEGQIRTMNGAILLGGNKFQIVSGLLELTDPQQHSPTLDILAVADIDAYQISANIFGPIDDPQIRLSSSPYLSQTDILNMIALGISSDGGGGGESGEQVTVGGTPVLSDIFGNRVTSFSGIDLFRAKLLNRDLFRLDLFKFKVGEESGEVEKITVGRDITKRLQLKYSIPANVEEREIAEAGYKLSDYVKLIGSQDDLGTYSLDLNLSFEF